MKPPKNELNHPNINIKEPKKELKSSKIDLNPPKVEVKVPKIEYNSPKTNKTISKEIKLKAPKINIKSPKTENKNQINLEFPEEEEEEKFIIIPKKSKLIIPKEKKDDSELSIKAPLITLKHEIKENSPRLSSTTKPLKIKIQTPELPKQRRPSVSNPTVRSKIGFEMKKEEAPQIQFKPRLSLRNPSKIKRELKLEEAPRISIRNPNMNISKSITEAPRISFRSKSKKGPVKIFGSSEVSYDDYEKKLSNDINNKDYIHTLTHLMSMDINEPIDLSNNYISEIKYNKYGGVEIGKPDYHLNYENRGFDFNTINENEYNNSNQIDNNLNIENENLNKKWNDKLKGNFGGIEYKLDDEPGEYIIEKKEYGYFQPIEYNIDIPNDLESIPNSKVKNRVHNPKIKENNTIRRRRSKVTLPPGLSSAAVIMQYTNRPKFHETITQQSNADLPVVQSFKEEIFDLNLLADYEIK